MTQKDFDVAWKLAFEDLPEDEEDVGKKLCGVWQKERGITATPPQAIHIWRWYSEEYWSAGFLAFHGEVQSALHALDEFVERQPYGVNEQ